MPATLVQLLCPACGQAFLNQQQHDLASQSCPHCAFTAPKARFEEIAPHAAAIGIQRREPKRSPIPQQTLEEPITTETRRVAPRHPRPGPVVAPSGWDVKEFQPILPSRMPVAPPSAPVPVAPPPVQENPAHWQVATPVSTTQIPREAPPEVPPAPAPVKQKHLVPKAPSQPALHAEDWQARKSGAQPKLADWPGMGPSVHETDASHFDVKKPRRYRIWLLVLLALLVVGSVLTAIKLERMRAAELISTMAVTVKSAPAAAPAEGAAPAPVLEIAETLPALPPGHDQKMTLEEINDRGTTLVTKLFSAKTAQDRLACIAHASLHGDSLTKFFDAHKEPIELTSFRALAAPVKVMPGSQLVVLCEVETSLRSQGTGITRLIDDDDGSQKLDWAMLHDSLQGALATYALKPSEQPQWIHLGLRRNFGFDEPESVRNDYLVFDIQGFGDGSDRTVAIVAKNTPTGRALAKSLSWNELYLVRTLLHWETVENRPRLAILDVDLVGTHARSQ